MAGKMGFALNLLKLLKKSKVFRFLWFMGPQGLATILLRMAVFWGRITEQEGAFLMLGFTCFSILWVVAWSTYLKESEIQGNW